MAIYILFSLFAIFLLCYGFYYEEKVIKFEQAAKVKICKFIIKILEG